MRTVVLFIGLFSILAIFAPRSRIIGGNLMKIVVMIDGKRTVIEDERKEEHRNGEDRRKTQMPCRVKERYSDRHRYSAVNYPRYKDWVKTCDRRKQEDRRKKT